jgi:small conductance mechanosensitive channel
MIKRLSNFILNRAYKNATIDDVEAEKRIKTLMGILLGIGKILIWATAIMVLLNKLNIDIKPILAGAGIVGLAVGFGAQELVRDSISGFFILLENQIRTGDVAIINGTGGSVEKIELRTTTLRDFSGVVHIFQNGKINTISNMTKEWSAVVLDMGVAYKEDPEKVIQIMTDVGLKMQDDAEFGPKIIEPIEVVGVDNFADSAVVIRARIKTRPIEQWNVGREYRKRLKKAFDQNGIEIPFPHTTIYWGDDIKPLKMEVDK